MLFYRIIRRLFRAVAAPMFRFRVEAIGHVPPSGPAVLVAAHRSWLDPACVGGACPRPVRFLIVESVYGKWWARWFYRRMQAIPVQPGGHASLGALRQAMRALAAGEVVGVFPEGRVVAEGPMGTIFGGAALLAARCGVPLIPVAIYGSARAWPHGRRLPGPSPVRVRFDAPIAPPRTRDRRAIEALRRELGERLAELQRTDGRP